MRALEIQGTTVPKLGFGTWEILGRDCEEAVADALEIGYRHIDTAQAYDNEAEVGKALAAAGRPAQRAVPDHEAVARRVRPRPRAAVGRRVARAAAGRAASTSCSCTGPTTTSRSRRRSARSPALREEGLVKHYGVSNFPAGMLRDALEIAPIFADQVEFHPFLGQDALVELAAEKDFMVTAYSPLARGKVPEDETLRAIGEAHGKTAGQVALRWLLDKPNVATIPKASSHERRVENFEVFDFELSDDGPREDRRAAQGRARDRPALGARLGRLASCPGVA